MALPEPHFVDRDPNVILRECITRYEELAQRPLVPSQVERLIIDLLVYRETLSRIQIQETAKQNLARYARYPMIDYLAEFLGAGRLDAQPAKTTERFTLEAARPGDIVIDAGTRVRSKDGRATFALAAPVTIPAGELSVEAVVVATEPGPAANGYAPGQVTELVDQLTGVTLAATNVTASADGTAEEDSDRLRERFPLVLSEYAVAGPEAAYRALARAAHQDVLDVHVASPSPMVVRVTVLARYGIPTLELLDVVEAKLTPEYVRPLCDNVEVAAAAPSDYEIVARLMLYRGAKLADVTAAAERAAEEYRAQRAAGLGRSPEPSQIIAALKVRGVYSVAIDQPVSVAVGAEQWARCTGITITVDGFVDEQEPT